MSFIEKLTDHVTNYQSANAEEITFSQYLEEVSNNPHVAQLSHARIYKMIEREGVETVQEFGEDHKAYNFFKGEIFGIDDVCERVTDYFHSSSKGLEIRKRILMLMGPPGSGKSTIAALLKQKLEDISIEEDGRHYSIKYPDSIHSEFAGQLCPMREEPLHAVPLPLRSEFSVKIEGDLCPRCRLIVDEYLDGDFTKLVVRRSLISEKRRQGIGVFQPSDTKSQDIADLVGSIDLATVGEYGSESDPRAYRFDGEANVANRGLLELVEMLKVDDKFLYLFLTLTQEQSIKAGRFPNIYADLVILAHTNESEFQSWISDKRSEALRDRVIVLTTPYNVKIDDEVKIYEKLISQTTILKDVHIDPQALRTAAMFAILTRLEEPKKVGMDIIKKLKLYNGESIVGVKEKDVKELKEETIREGMDGIGPRYIINQLARALVKDNKKCLTTIDTLRSLKDGLDTSPGIAKEDKERYLNFINEARKEYDSNVQVEIQRAFVHSFESQANTLLKIYLDNVEAYCNTTKVRDAITGEDIEPDEKLMRSIEEQIAINDAASRSFREDVLMRIASYYRQNKKFEYNSHPRLKEAIQKKLFHDLKDIVKITTNTRTPDKEQLEKLNSVAARLMDEHAYCSVCANNLLEYVGTLLNR